MDEIVIHALYIQSLKIESTENMAMADLAHWLSVSRFLLVYYRYAKYLNCNENELLLDSYFFVLIVIIFILQVM